MNDCYHADLIKTLVEPIDSYPHLGYYGVANSLPISSTFVSCNFSAYVIRSLELIAVCKTEVLDMTEQPRTFLMSYNIPGPA